MNPWIMPMMIPIIPSNNMKPPTIYSILDSICNFDSDEITKIKDLSKVGRTKIFDFDYPLSENISKEKFECMILNHFLQRRIGFQTVTAFKIQLDVKLNEIMPIYNKLFDSLEDWNIFNDGEKTIRDLKDKKTSTSNSKTTNSIESNSKTNNENIADLRYSKTPQNKLDNIKDGSYITDYNYNTTNNNGNDESYSSGESTGTNDTKDKNILHEEINRTPSDKIAIYKEFQENLKSIYRMIFDELECLFYQII